MKKLILWAARGFGYEPVPVEKLADWARSREELTEGLEQASYDLDEARRVEAHLRESLADANGQLALERASLAAMLNHGAALEKNCESLGEQLEAARAAHQKDREIYAARLAECEARETSLGVQLEEARAAYMHARTQEQGKAARLADLERSHAAFEEALAEANRGRTVAEASVQALVSQVASLERAQQALAGQEGAETARRVGPVPGEDEFPRLSPEGAPLGRIS